MKSHFYVTELLPWTALRQLIPDFVLIILKSANVQYIFKKKLNNQLRNIQDFNLDVTQRCPNERDK